MSDTLLADLKHRLPTIEAFERAYRLPTVAGTERQCAWARMIRVEFIDELLRDIMTATKDLSPSDAKEVFHFVAAARNEPRAEIWIETFRLHRGGAAHFILAQPAKQAEQRRKLDEAVAEQKRIQAKAAETRVLTKTAGDFEKLHGLPPLLAQRCSTSQENFGRRCRFALLRDLTADELVSRKDEIDNQTDAGYWIGQFLKHEKAAATNANASPQMNDHVHGTSVSADA